MCKLMRNYVLLIFIAVHSIVFGQQELMVRGNVTSQQGEPLPGVNIVIKGTTSGTVTSTDGNFEINIADPANAVLLFNFIGFTNREISVNGQNRLDVVMSEAMIGLEEVIAIGYGTMRKSDLTGAVSSVSAEDIANNPTNNALEALQGRVGGLDLTRSSGQAGAGLNFLIRGQRSLQASNSPLILVDGIDYGSNLDLNPSDIASMEILKDASSTAIYGSRGANGVILITTKRGVSGDTKISFNSYYSINSLSGMPKFMNGSEYVQLRRDSHKAAGSWSSPDDDSSIFGPQQLEYIAKGQYEDWMDLVFNDGYTQNYELAMSGGNDKTLYTFSLGFMDEQGLLKTNDQFKRYNGRLTVDHNVRENLKVGASALYTFKNQDQRYAPFNVATKVFPIAKAYNEDGSVNPYPAAGATMMNPLLDEIDGRVTDNVETNRFFSSSYVNWSIVEELAFNTNLGVDYQNVRHGMFYDEQTLLGGDNKSQSSANLTNIRKVTWENTLNYNVNVGMRQGLNILGGSSVIDRRRENYSIEGKDQASPTTEFYDLGSNTSEVMVSSELVEESMVSFFGRVNYKFDEKYLITASLRADGSSVLADGNKWGYFPSVAVAWRLSQESFLSDVYSLSNLKLRVSWGESGQSAISPYSTLGALGSSMYAFYDQAAHGYYPSEIANPDLKWEITEVINFGLDFGFWNNRLSGTIDLYESNTSDLLMSRLLPNTTGFSSVMENIGKTRGRGFDFSLSSLNFDRSNFKWVSDLTLTYNQNEIIQLSGEIDRDVANNWFVGEPISVFYDYKQTGIWQSDEVAEAAIHGLKPGDVKVADLNGDGVLTPEDRHIYNRSPKYTFGLNNKWSYMNFDLSMFMYGRFGHYINYEYYGMYRADASENSAAVSYWTEENPSNKFPGASTSSYRNRAYISSISYMKGDFWKIRDLTLAYNFSDQIINSLNISKLRVYVTLKNHFTFSDLKDYDPERGGSLNYPLTKQTVFGVNLEF